MKYAVILIDGMADHPLPELGGKTPIEAAKTPVLDGLAQKAQFGTFVTLPSAFPTSSDVANMSVLGWDSGLVVHRARRHRELRAGCAA